VNDARKIIHIDMDAFYAAVEQRDHAEYRGKPIVVGGDPDGRGVVATASYEARPFGIHSAQPAAAANRLCPHAIFLRPRMAYYAAESRQIMGILREYTDLVEPLSLDESENKKGEPYASRVARQIKAQIKEGTGLTASAGVGPNKFIAKIASDMDKPDGLKVITPEEVPAFLEGLPIRKVPGIGPATEKKMAAMGVETVGALKARSEAELVEVFGKAGRWYYRMARGDDPRPVAPVRQRKSIGAERTFPKDLNTRPELEAALVKIAELVEERMEKKGVRGKTITLKLTYSDFTRVTRSRSLDGYHADAKTLTAVGRELLEQTEAPHRSVRLVGLQVSNLDTPVEGPHEDTFEQLTFSF